MAICRQMVKHSHILELGVQVTMDRGGIIRQDHVHLSLRYHQDSRENAVLMESIMQPIYLDLWSDRHEVSTRWA